MIYRLTDDPRSFWKEIGIALVLLLLVSLFSVGLTHMRVKEPTLGDVITRLTEEHQLNVIQQQEITQLISQWAVKDMSVIERPMNVYQRLNVRFQPNSMP